MELINLPSDILFCIADYLSANELSTLSRTNPCLSVTISPYLYRKNVLSQGQFGRVEPLLYGVDNGLPRTVELALTNGATDTQSMAPRNEYLRQLFVAACKGRWRDMEQGYQRRRVTRTRNGPALWPYTSPSYDEVMGLLLENGAGIADCEWEGPESLLHIAASRSDEVLMRLLIENGAPVCDNGLLHAVIRDRYHDLREDGSDGHGLGHVSARIVRLLLEKGLDMDAVDVDVTPLYLAADVGNTSLVKVLVENGADMRPGGPCGFTPLHAAALGGKNEVIQQLIQYGADVDAAAVDEKANRLTPVQCAIQSRRTNTFKLLMRLGANILEKNELGEKALDLAVLRGIVKIDRDFLEDVNAEILIRHTGDTRLHLAAAYGDGDAVLHVLQQNPDDIEALNRVGDTPLLRAASTGTPKAVQCLTKNGAHATASPITTQTPLHIVATRKDVPKSILTHLLNAGAELEATDRQGNTPLHHAAESGNHAVAEFLVKAGANMDARNSQRNTPLHCASVPGHEAVVSYLLRAGADVDAGNASGDTPLHAALRFLPSPESVVWTLLANGADLDLPSSNGETPRQFCKKLAAEGYKGVVEELIYCVSRARSR